MVFSFFKIFFEIKVYDSDEEIAVDEFGEAVDVQGVADKKLHEAEEVKIELQVKEEKREEELKEITKQADV